MLLSRPPPRDGEYSRPDGPAGRLHRPPVSEPKTWRRAPSELKKIVPPVACFRDSLPTPPPIHCGRMLPPDSKIICLQFLVSEALTPSTSVVPGKTARPF